MQDNARKLTYGAMMIVIFVILLATSVYVPLIGTITMLFTPLPIILYRLRYDRTASIFVLVVGIIFSLVGGLLLLPVALVFGPLGLVIGEAIDQQKTKLYTFMSAGLTFIITTIILYLMTVMLFEVNIVDEVSVAMVESQQQAMAILEKTGELPENFVEQLNDMFDYTFKVIPGAFIITSYLIAFGIIIINLPIVQRLGHAVPKFPPFRKMKLPLHTVWAYMIIILLPFISNMEPGSTIELIYLNGTFILKFLFLLQGISFIHHVTNEMKTHKVVTGLLTLVAIMFNPLTIIIGILDTGIHIRDWIGKNKST